MVITQHNRDILEDSGSVYYAAHFHGLSRSVILPRWHTVKPVSWTSGIGPKRRRDCARSGGRTSERERGGRARAECLRLRENVRETAYRVRCTCEEEGQRRSTPIDRLIDRFAVSRTTTIPNINRKFSPNLNI